MPTLYRPTIEQTCAQVLETLRFTGGTVRNDSMPMITRSLSVRHTVTQPLSSAEIFSAHLYLRLLRPRKQNFPVQHVQNGQLMESGSQEKIMMEQNKIEEARRITVLYDYSMKNRMQAIKECNIMSVATQKYMIAKQCGRNKFEVAAGDAGQDEGVSTIYYHKYEGQKSAAALVLKCRTYTLQLCYKEQKLQLQIIEKDDKYDPQHLFILHQEEKVYSFQCQANQDLYVCVSGENIDVSKKNEQTEDLQFQIHENS
ncbi:uncharacterized protein LOC115097864 isoform X2 [Rhinatrema bivittatum]|uniref:uncharacterized protein LOC115097864 isoform X2 n=1 Tax=Rhinatrema bivittatum TaxID=194408 RepID=UPI001129AD87|nr:uncharacterized protein LOC115097864 isoform X2 [Rhinatrema bivittatum]